MNRDHDPTPEAFETEGPIWESDADLRAARKRRMLVFGGSAAAVLVGFVGLYAVLNWIAGGIGDDPAPPEGGSVTTRDVGGDAVVAPPPSAIVITEPIDVSTDIEWYAVEAPLGYAERLFATNTGNFYALSTIPGQVNVWPAPKAIYKSTDGELWDIIDLDANIGANDMAVGGETIYLIGTSPAVGDFDEPADFVVSTSSDAGTTWTQTVLPSVAAPPDGVPIEWTNISTRIAVNDESVIAVVNSQFFLDYRRLMPPELSGDNFGFNPTEDGVSVMDYELLELMYQRCDQELFAVDNDTSLVSEECRMLFEGGEGEAAVVAFVTWEELGLEDGTPLFAELFVSNDGVNFEAIDSPFRPGTDIGQVYGLAEGFIAVEHGPMGQRILQSPDGRSWDAPDGIPEFDWITSAGAIGGKSVVVGARHDSSLVAWENDAGGWDVTDLNDVLGPLPAAQGGRWINSAGIGPLGVVAVLNTVDERAGGETIDVVMGTAPDSWSVVPIIDITGMPNGYSDAVVVGPEEVMIRYTVFEPSRIRPGGPLNLQVIGTLAT